MIVVSARDVATSRIARRAREFPDFALAPLDTEALDARDAALAVAIDQAVARRWLTLATVLGTRVQRSWPRVEPAVQAPLLAGAAQLLLLERLPDHAVISEAVEWTKHHANRKASGLVNAVLRRIAELRDEIVETHDPARRDELPLADGRAWRLHEPVFDDDPMTRLGQQTSHGVPLLEHWRRTFDEATMQSLARHSLVRPPVVLHGIDPSHPDLEPHDEPGFAVYAGPRGGLDALLRDHPDAIVQDAGSATAIAATSQLTPDVIVDACAGQGTKTRQLLAMHPSARVIATDRADARRAVLRRTFEGDDRVEVVEPAALRDRTETADLLLLDVPCSNTGVLARRVEARYRWDAASLASLVDEQRQIVADHLALLAPGGTLLYCTCSIEPAENQEQAEWITHWHTMSAGLRRALLPTGEPGDPARVYRDGGFFAFLRRS